MLQTEAGPFWPVSENEWLASWAWSCQGGQCPCRDLRSLGAEGVCKVETRVGRVQAEPALRGRHPKVEPRPRQTKEFTAGGGCSAVQAGGADSAGTADVSGPPPWA